MATANILLETDPVAAASLENVAVTSLAGQVTTAHLEELLRVFVPHQQRWSTMSVSLTLVRGRIPLPDASARALLQSMHAAGATANVACVVLEADGFWAAGARGVLASMALVSRKAPYAVRTLREALTWCADRVPAGAPDVQALEAEIARFRAAHLARVDAGAG